MQVPANLTGSMLSFLEGHVLGHVKDKPRKKRKLADVVGDVKLAKAKDREDLTDKILAQWLLTHPEDAIAIAIEVEEDA